MSSLTCKCQEANFEIEQLAQWFMCDLPNVQVISNIGPAFFHFRVVLMGRVIWIMFWSPQWWSAYLCANTQLSESNTGLNPLWSFEKPTLKWTLWMLIGSLSPGHGLGIPGWCSNGWRNLQLRVIRGTTDLYLTIDDNACKLEQGTLETKYHFLKKRAQISWVYFCWDVAFYINAFMLVSDHAINLEQVSKPVSSLLELQSKQLYLDKCKG